MASPVERPDVEDLDVASLAVAIAQDTGAAPEVVQKIYEEEWSSLASEAKITQFIGVLVTRRVRMLLRKH